MRVFIDLLPFRVGQALSFPAFRRLRTRRARAALPGASERGGVGTSRLFIDMSVICRHDAGTGIQRVVREVALAILAEAAPEWEVRFVSASRKQPYHRIAWPDGAPSVAPERMEAQPGDVFLGLDYALDSVRRYRRQLRAFRQGGGDVWFLVHDLLPIQHPGWFSRNTVVRYKAWLAIGARLATGFLCNSFPTDADLRQALAERHGLRAGYRTQVIPMGHALADQDRAMEAGFRLRPGLSGPFALMVGTLEPRKGHADILNAFEELWAQGRAERLVLVGRLGWKVEDLRDRILSHPDYGHRLFWYDNVGDAELSGFYEACTGVVVASYGEGFGLPVIEALGRRKPVIARDLEVFRLHEDRGVVFFPFDASPQDLALLLGEWLERAGRGEIAVVPPVGDWREAARVTLQAVGAAD